MIRVHVIVEGPTEQIFVNNLLGPLLNAKGVYPFATLLGVRKHAGGRVNFARVEKDVVTALRQGTAYCTTMFDFYGLHGEFPGMERGGRLPSQQQADVIESALHASVCKRLGDAFDPRRFRPYLRVHEHEALLFSAPKAFAESLLKPNLAEEFQAIRNSFPTPEDINDSWHTAPSKRILKLFPRYSKTSDGALAARAVGIDAMCKQCTRFGVWVNWLLSLGESGK